METALSVVVGALSTMIVVASAVMASVLIYLYACRKRGGSTCLDKFLFKLTFIDLGLCCPVPDDTIVGGGECGYLAVPIDESEMVQLTAFTKRPPVGGPEPSTATTSESPRNTNLPATRISESSRTTNMSSGVTSESSEGSALTSHRAFQQYCLLAQAKERAAERFTLMARQCLRQARNHVQVERRPVPRRSLYEAYLSVRAAQVSLQAAEFTLLQDGGGQESSAQRAENNLREQSHMKLMQMSFTAALSGQPTNRPVSLHAALPFRPSRNQNDFQFRTVRDSSVVPNSPRDASVVPNLCSVRDSNDVPNSLRDVIADSPDTQFHSVEDDDLPFLSLRNGSDMLSSVAVRNSTVAPRRSPGDDALPVRGVRRCATRVNRHSDRPVSMYAGTVLRPLDLEHCAPNHQRTLLKKYDDHHLHKSSSPFANTVCHSSSVNPTKQSNAQTEQCSAFQVYRSEHFATNDLSEMKGKIERQYRNEPQEIHPYLRRQPDSVDSHAHLTEGNAQKNDLSATSSAKLSARSHEIPADSCVNTLRSSNKRSLRNRQHAKYSTTATAELRSSARCHRLCPSLLKNGTSCAAVGHRGSQGFQRSCSSPRFDYIPRRHTVYYGRGSQFAQGQLITLPMRSASTSLQVTADLAGKVIGCPVYESRCQDFSSQFLSRTPNFTGYADTQNASMDCCSPGVSPRSDAETLRYRLQKDQQKPLLDKSFQSCQLSELVQVDPVQASVVDVSRLGELSESPRGVSPSPLRYAQTIRRLLEEDRHRAQTSSVEANCRFSDLSGSSSGKVGSQKSAKHENTSFVVGHAAQTSAPQQNSSLVVGHYSLQPGKSSLVKSLYDPSPERRDRYVSAHRVSHETFATYVSVSSNFVGAERRGKCEVFSRPPPSVMSRLSHHTVKECNQPVSQSSTSERFAVRHPREITSKPPPNVDSNSLFQSVANEHTNAQSVLTTFTSYSPGPTLRRQVRSFVEYRPQRLLTDTERRRTLVESQLTSCLELDPLAHAATGTANSTCVCMRKEVKLTSLSEFQTAIFPQGDDFNSFSDSRECPIAQKAIGPTSVR